MTHVIVIGGGVIGALSAYYLDRAGIKVTLLEKENSLATGASGINAAQLSYTYVSPLGSPAIWKLMIRAFSGQMPDVRVTKFFDPQMWSFGWRLLRESSQTRYDINQAALLRLTMESRALMDEFLQRHALSFNHQRNGKLHIFVSDQQRRNAEGFAKKMLSLGIVQKFLTREECIARYPALKDRTGPFFGGVLSPADDGGDCRLFTDALPALYSSNVSVRTSASVARILIENKKAVGVETSGGAVILADKVLVCAGAEAYFLLKSAGVSVPLYPIKGYSATLPMQGWSLGINVTDHYRRCVFAPLGDRLRISAGMHFSGYDRSVCESITMHFRQMINGVFPNLDTTALRLNTGLRPYLPTSAPLTGTTDVQNLYMNIGHAMLGWTTAQATSKRIADIVTRDA